MKPLIDSLFEAPVDQNLQRKFATMAQTPIKQGKGLFDLPNELLDKIVDFALDNSWEESSLLTRLAKDKFVYAYDSDEPSTAELQQEKEDLTVWKEQNFNIANYRPVQDIRNLSLSSLKLSRIVMERCKKAGTFVIPQSEINDSEWGPAVPLPEEPLKKALEKQREYAEKECTSAIDSISTVQLWRMSIAESHDSLYVDESEESDDEEFANVYGLKKAKPWWEEMYKKSNKPV